MSTAVKSTPAEALVKSVAEKRLVFTVTTGRTGTNLLAKALGVSRKICSVHESKPFTLSMRSVQVDPGLATKVWTEEMLPEICAQPRPIYAESGHLVCKGYIEPLLELGLTPDLIHIRREPRQVALSYTSLDSIPGRSERGLKYLLSPEDPGVLPLEGFEQLNDYQLNYWYCLEIERRAEALAELVRARGGRVTTLPFQELVRFDGFQRFWGEFELPELGSFGWWRIKRVLSRKVNAKAKSKRSVQQAPPPPEELDSLEREVLERAGLA